ncbi:DUF3022 domain-containing protein [Burkholderia pseudomultivorans]|uniref:DUF3022 domain-containing protein n=1 Tax=Burkholderia pseudomultivorans TaxID=1207504 RepID=A0A132EA04_9BURK|nr:DUF3022 domain-containing protein [Burkholderia pseudomultivorans]KWF22777.1 hypothetical protein WT56_01125 [Burkholderia pseudomultivorans]
MQSNSRIGFDTDDLDLDGDAADADDLNTTVQFDVATGRITFHAAWAVAADAPPDAVRHAVVLALDSDTMERYADLDEGARMRVHAMLHDSVQQMLDELPAVDDEQTLTVELTDAMLDMACRLQ